jgi:hypothetical protein
MIGILNFLASYAIFVSLWFLLSEFINYFLIALLTTILNSLLSFYSQLKYNFKTIQFKSTLALRYVLIQIFWLLIGAFSVPQISDISKTSVPIVQLAFTVIIVLTNWKFYANKEGKL